MQKYNPGSSGLRLSPSPIIELSELMSFVGELSGLISFCRALRARIDSGGGSELSVLQGGMVSRSPTSTITSTIWGPCSVSTRGDFAVMTHLAPTTPIWALVLIGFAAMACLAAAFGYNYS